MAIDTPKDSRGRDLPPLETKETDAQIRTRKRRAELKEKKRKADLKQKADKKKEANRPKDRFGRKLPPLITEDSDNTKAARKRKFAAEEKKRKADLKQKADKKKEAKKDIVKDISKLSDKKYYDDVPKKVDTKKEKKKVPSVSFGKAFADARGAGKKTFMWNGKSYNTKRADDKPAAAPTKKLDDIAPTDIKTTAELGPLTDENDFKKGVDQYVKDNKPKKEMTRVEMGKNQMNAARKSMGMKKGGRVKGKCKVDGIAKRGRTRAKHK